MAPVGGIADFEGAVGARRQIGRNTDQEVARTMAGCDLEICFANDGHFLNIKLVHLGLGWRLLAEAVNKGNHGRCITFNFNKDTGGRILDEARQTGGGGIAVYGRPEADPLHAPRDGYADSLSHAAESSRKSPAGQLMVRRVAAGDSRRLAEFPGFWYERNMPIRL